MWIRTQNRERLIDVKNVAVSLSKIDGKYLVFTNDDGYRLPNAEGVRE